VLTLAPLTAAAQLAAPAAPAEEAPAAPAPAPAQDELYQAALRTLADGHPDEAVDLLARLIQQEPRHAGAWLELAITQCDLGKAEEAERLFRQIEQRFNPPPGILEVIANHRARGCQPLVSTPPGSWQLGIGRGHDSNVNQGTSTPTFTIGGVPGELTSEFLPHADSYALLTGSYVRQLNADGTVAIVQFYDRRNDHEHEQDSASVLLGLEHPWKFGNWRVRTTGAYGAVTLDGKLYQRQEQLQVRVTPPLALPNKLELAAITNLSHISYPTRDSYGGNTVELGGVLSYRSKYDQGQFTLSRLRDNGPLSRPGGDRDGWFASAQWYTLLRTDLYGELSLSQQHWQGSHVYAPELVDVVRHQNTSSARAALQWYFRPNLSLHVEGRLVRNRENISLFAYNSRALQLSLRWDNF
jgi:hypothetical protein